MQGVSWIKNESESFLKSYQVCFVFVRRAMSGLASPSQGILLALIVNYLGLYFINDLQYLA